MATIRFGMVYHQSKRPLLVVTRGGGEGAGWPPWGDGADSSSKQLILTATGLEAGGHCCPGERGQRQRRTAIQRQGWLPILFFFYFMNMHTFHV